MLVTKMPAQVGQSQKQGESGCISIEDLTVCLEQHFQDHLLDNWCILPLDERARLLQNFGDVNFGEAVEFFKKCQSSEDGCLSSNDLRPISDPEHFGSWRDSTDDNLQKFWRRGLEAIAHGEVAVILLAGGQGTRLGVSYPKGMYDVGLQSRKTLYQLQAERIIRLQTLAREAFPGSTGVIHWYIMTSEATCHETKLFFEKHANFGLSSEQMFYFEQGLLPCFSFSGKIILETASRIAKAPDGNGGLYRALTKCGALDHMIAHEVKYVHVYCVDNILVRIADPTFVGFCLTKGADCGNKVVEKTEPDEPVGVVCQVVGNGPRVVEYSELPQSLKELRDEEGRLTYRAGNIANHFFTVEFLSRVCQSHENELIHHVAKKKIPYWDPSVAKCVTPDKPNGIKMEKFVFDVFQFSQNFVVWEVPRESEFSPLKNTDQAGIDCPCTCRTAVYRLHKSWLSKAGAKLRMENGEVNGDHAVAADKCRVLEVEVSPLVSYGGEDLTWLSGHTFSPPVLIDEHMKHSNGFSA